MLTIHVVIGKEKLYLSYDDNITRKPANSEKFDRYLIV